MPPVVPLLVLAVAQPPDPPPAKPLTVSPAAEPRPALRIELLPPIRDRTDEDAAVAYYRAFLLRPRMTTDPKKAQAAAEELERWLKPTPLDQLPRDAVRARLEQDRHVFHELDRAVTAGRCEWGTLPRLRRDGVGTLLPELQETREVAQLLALRCRLELAEGRFADAEKSLRTGFQMARHVGEAPTLIQLLVGLAVQGIFLDRVEDWASRPDAPNLYWALSALPDPLIDPRPAFQGEELFVEASLAGLRKLRGGPLPHDEAGRLVDSLLASAGQLAPAGKLDGDNTPTVALTRIGFAAYVVWSYPAAKKELVARGRPAAEVEKMAGGQVVLLNSLERFLELRDDQWKWVGQPYHLARPHLAVAEARSRDALAAHRDDPFFRLLTQLLPASAQVTAAVARTQRRVAALRVIEAVRMYAAGHDGRPPAKLADITAVPIPDDPFTGKPFEYAADGRTFTLTGPPPAGEKADQRNSLRYAVTVR